MNATKEKAVPFGRRYPWDKWFARDRFTLIRGRDYDGATHGMMQQVRNAAGPRRHNLKVSIKVSPSQNSLTVYVIGRSRRAETGGRRRA